LLFNSLEYALFLPFVLLVYFRLRHRQQNVFFLAASYVFYAQWDWRFLSLLILSTALDYAIGRTIEAARRRQDASLAKRWLVASIVANLGILGVFKYYGFFVESLNVLLAQIGVVPARGLIEIVLPVGISFYTFQSLSYTIDIYREKLRAVDDPVDYALFVAFFPQLVAGPIERATHLLPQIQQPRTVHREDWERGVYLILLGLVRKVAIADTAGGLVDRIFENPGGYTSMQLGVGAVLYAIQIYSDFAGYSDIARGSARMMGFDLMRNFRHPYFATDPSDFWRRWHISLSTWIRDYLFIPLGGSRGGAARTCVNLIVSLTLSGLWHGAAWNFVAWGFAHGVILAVQRIYREWRGDAGAPLPSESSERERERQEDQPHQGWRLRHRMGALDLLRGLATFSVVALLFILFRGGDGDTIMLYMTGLAEGNLNGEFALIPLTVLTTLVLAIDVPQALNDDEYVFLKLGAFARPALAALAVLLIVFGGRASAPFIYFQF
jgi:alginate O-acetyltransferase complex protein AlgI